MNKKIFIVCLITLASLFSFNVAFAAYDVWGYAWAHPEGDPTEPTIGYISMNSSNNGTNTCWDAINDSYDGLDPTGNTKYVSSVAMSPGSYLQTKFKLSNVGTALGASVNYVDVRLRYKGDLGNITIDDGICSGLGNATVSDTNHGAGWTWALAHFTAVNGCGVFLWSDINNLVLTTRVKGDAAASYHGMITDVKVTVGYEDFSGNSQTVDLFPNGENAGDCIGLQPPPSGVVTAPYSVSIDAITGLFSGWAWSENIGWITFNKWDLNDCPSGACEASIALTGANVGKVSGWAKPLMSKTYEYYSGPGAAIQNVGGDWWKGQTFTIGNTGPDESFNITSAKFKAYRVGLPGNVTVSVRGVDGSGHPTGADRCSGFMDGNTITTDAGGGWFEVGLNPLFLAGCRLSAGTKYALVIRAPSGATDSLRLLRDDPSNYSGGNREDAGNTSGVTWSAVAGDYKFEIMGSNFKNWIKLNPDSAVAASNAVRLVGSEFQGWAFGGANSNDEAVIGWISFNHVTGGGSVDYKVETDLNISVPPIAGISCESPLGTVISPCEVFQGTPVFIVNTSTNSTTITQTQWFSKSEPTGSLTLQNTCVFCNYTPSLGLDGASDYRNYTIKLDVTDGSAPSTATKTLTVKRSLTADFQCRLKTTDPWQTCTTLNPVSGDVILLNDISNPSYAAGGSSITSRTWNKTDIEGSFDFGGTNNPVPTIGFKAPSAVLRLTVTDSVGKTQSVTYTINGRMRLPTWKEVTPAW